MFKNRQLLVSCILILCATFPSIVFSEKIVFSIPSKLDGVVYQTKMYIEFDYTSLGIPLDGRHKSDKAGVNTLLEFHSGIMNKNYSLVKNYISPNLNYDKYYGGLKKYIDTFNESLSKYESLKLTGYFTVKNKKRFLITGKLKSGQERMLSFVFMNHSSGKYLYSPNESSNKIDSLLSMIIRISNEKNQKLRPLVKSKIALLAKSGYKRYNIRTENITLKDNIFMYIKAKSLLTGNIKNKQGGVGQVEDKMNESLRTGKLNDYLDFLGEKSREKVSKSISKMSKYEKNEFISMGFDPTRKMVTIEANPLYVLFFSYDIHATVNTYLYAKEFLKIAENS